MTLSARMDFHFPTLYTAKKKLLYPKARIMDMALFQYGLSK
ncbi:hypothetical protein BV352_05276 [Pseudomonas syringae pv. actinidiae]|nr:hypothetical protein BV352_05276 [Pseudomonas syringae pv. actinidiae]